jgi:superfamily II DNA helicase RecQ
MSDLRIARSYFGVASLKAEQRECIEQVTSGKDVLAILRTGFGKSLCYQVACVQLPGFAIVVTPLLALAMDQLQFLRAHGLECLRFDSSVEHGSRVQYAQQMCEKGTTIKAVFTTPETLAQSGLLITALRQASGNGNVSFVVIDEAHCVDTWSEFRCVRSSG